MTRFMTQLNFDNQVRILPSVLDATQRAVHRHLRRSHQRRHRRQLVDARHRRRQSLQDQPKVILSFTLSLHDKLILSKAANLGIKRLLVCERPISRTHCREDRKKAKLPGRIRTRDLTTCALLLFDVQLLHRVKLDIVMAQVVKHGFAVPKVMCSNPPGCCFLLLI